MIELFFFFGKFCFFVTDEDNDENEEEEKEETEHEREQEKVVEEKNDEGDEEKEDESIPDDEHVNDLERAFEILECAHMIYSKMLENEPNNAHIITRLGDIHVMLADICNENGDHENALSNVLKAIDLQETINEQQRYRLLAESYYKLGLIYELINKFSEAVESFDKSINILQQAIDKITDNDKENEREELKSLLPAIELKRNDAQTSLADKHLIAQARNLITGTNRRSHTTDNTTTEASVKDLTSAIRHKRPMSDTEKNEEENKKSKKDEN